jgi:hypothetical protein
MSRKLLWAFLVIGVVLFTLPLVISMPGKAGAGETMMQNFQPIMQPAQVQTTVRYYNDVFVPLGKVAPAFNDGTVATFDGYLKAMAAMPAEGEKLMGSLAQQYGMTPAELQTVMAAEYPALTGLLQTMPQLQQDFGGLLTLMKQNTAVFAEVPAGLAHYKPLVNTMEANVGNYDQVSSLPNFNLFTVFFMVPGALLVVLAAYGLRAGRLPRASAVRATPTPTH